MIKIKIGRNVILNNRKMINLSGSWVPILSAKVAKIVQIRKIQRFNKSDTDNSDLIIKCFEPDKSCQKLYLKQLIFQL